MFWKRSPRFDAPDLRQLVEAMTPDAIDALPFGTIRTDANGTITQYSRTEARLSGYDGTRPIGLNFFTAVAPCTDTPEFRGRIERARQAGLLDIEFGHTGDFSDPQRTLRVRVLSAADGGCWIFLQRSH